MKKNIIYIYTTKTWRTLGYYKIGGTKLSGKIRVEQQDGTSCPEELELVFEIETNLWDQDFKDENGIKQKGIHSLLEMLGYEKTRKRREWFEGFESDEDVIVQVLKVINQNGKITKKYKPYFYKTIIEEKIIDRLLLDVKNGLIDIDFVLELAPRFGKNTFMLNLMKKLFTDFGYTAALLPSYWLSTHSSLKSDLLKYEPKTGFSDHLRYVGRDEDLNQVLLENQGKKMLVIEVSLHENDLQNRLKPLDNIPRNKKVSFQDEVDFGSWKPKQQKQINEMGCGLKFHLTGSNIYKILSTLGDVDDRFFQFSYTDMLLMRDGSHPWLKGVSDEELVEITKSLKDIITPRIYKLTLDTFIDRNNSVPDEFKTKWSKLLSDVNQNQSQLTPLIQSLFGEYDGDFNEMFLNLNVRSDVPMNVSVMFCNTRNQEEQKNNKKKNNLILKNI